MRARAACRCSRSTPTAPAGDFDVLAFNLVGRARLHEPPELHRPRRRAGAGRATARPSTRSSIAGGHCTFNPEPLADFVDAFVIGDGEEVVGEITEVVGAWKRGGRADAARRVLRELATIPGVYVPVDVRRRVRRPAHRRGRRRATPTCPSGSTSAPSPTSPTGRTRSSSSCRSSRSCTTGSTSRSSAAAPAAAASARPGMITRPVRERPADQVRTMVQRRPAPHRLRRGRAHVAVERRLLRHRRRRRRPRQRPGGLRQRRRLAAVACGSTRSPSASRAEIQKVRRTGLTFAPEARHVAACAR